MRNPFVRRISCKQLASYVLLNLPETSRPVNSRIAYRETLPKRQSVLSLMGYSTQRYGGVLKWGYPQIINFLFSIINNP